MLSFTPHVLDVLMHFYITYFRKVVRQSILEQTFHGEAKFIEKYFFAFSINIFESS